MFRFTQIYESWIHYLLSEPALCDGDLNGGTGKSIAVQRYATYPMSIHAEPRRTEPRSSDALRTRSSVCFWYGLSILVVVVYDKRVGLLVAAAEKPFTE